MDEAKVKELLQKLEDPNISPALKSTIKAGIERAMQGGYSTAYDETLKYRARTDLNAFSEYVYGLVPLPHHREITSVLQDESKRLVAMVLPPGAGKCLAEDTLVTMADRSLKMIKDVEVGEEVVSIDSNHKQSTSVVAHKEDTGQKECFRLQAESGYTVTASGDHKFYTSRGWKRLKDINEEDYVAAPYSHPDDVKVADSDLRWVKVKEVSEAGTLQTYDIQVEEDNNFFGNGLLTHNSTYVSQIFLPWYIAKHPEHSTILVSSSQQQSVKFSADIRSALVANERLKEVFPDISLDSLKGDSKEQIYLERKRQNPHPNLFAAGVESTKVLGSRAHVIVCDDIQTQKAARSVVETKNQREWFEGTLMTRPIEGEGRIISIMTRWSGKDMGAFMMNNLNFEVVHMPVYGDPRLGAYVDLSPQLFTEEVLAEISETGQLNIDYNAPLAAVPEFAKIDYEERLEQQYEEVKKDESIRRVDVVFSEATKRNCIRKFFREDTEPSIWPEYFTDQRIKSLKASRGSVSFNLIYQGNPVASEGEIFKLDWMQYYGSGTDADGNEYAVKKVPDGSEYYISVDPAISQKTSADFFVASVVARDREGNLYVVEVHRTKLEAYGQRDLIKRLYQQYPQTIWVLIESVAYQQSLFQDMLREGVPCRPYRPKAGNDKEMRARSTSAMFEAKKVYINAHAHWVEDFVEEFTSFPKGDKDDQVDSVSSLVEELSLQGTRDPITYRVGFG